MPDVFHTQGLDEIAKKYQANPLGAPTLPKTPDDPIFDTSRLDEIAKRYAPAKPKAQPVSGITRDRERYIPPGAENWSIDNFDQIGSRYRQQFGQVIPTRAFGQGNIHNSQGWDHRNAVDVPVDPNSERGKWILNDLRTNNVPFQAMYRAIKNPATGRISSTGPHIHIGLPSHSTNERFPVGTRQGPQTSPTFAEPKLDIGRLNEIAAKYKVPVPEHPETLTAQAQSAARPDSPKLGILVTPGAKPPSIPSGFTMVDTPKGKLYFDPAKVKAAGITDPVAQMDRILGTVEPVADTSQGNAVVARDPVTERELEAKIVTTPETAQAQAKVNAQMHPDSVPSVEPAQSVVAQRQGANKYAQPDWQQHLTKLNPQDEQDFQTWAKRNKAPITDDYDMRGFWDALRNKDPRAGTSVNANDGRMHFPDTWKTPLHKSFSNESIYATPDAPKWNDKDQLVDTQGNVVFDERAQQPAQQPPVVARRQQARKVPVRHVAPAQPNDIRRFPVGRIPNRNAPDRGIRVGQDTTDPERLHQQAVQAQLRGQYEAEQAMRRAKLAQSAGIDFEVAERAAGRTPIWESKDPAVREAWSRLLGTAEAQDQRELARSQESQIGISADTLGAVGYQRPKTQLRAAPKTEAANAPEVEQRYHDVIATLTPSEKRFLADSVQEVTAQREAQGNVGETANTGMALAGILRTAHVPGSETAERWAIIRREAVRQALEQMPAEERDSVVRTIATELGAAPQALGRLLLLSKLPGGAYTGMAGDAALQAIGEHQPASEVARRTVGGLGNAALFGKLHGKSLPVRALGAGVGSQVIAGALGDKPTAHGAIVNALFGATSGGEGEARPGERPAERTGKESLQVAPELKMSDANIAGRIGQLERMNPARRTERQKGELASLQNEVARRQGVAASTPEKPVLSEQIPANDKSAPNLSRSVSMDEVRRANPAPEPPVAVPVRESAPTVAPQPVEAAQPKPAPETVPVASTTEQSSSVQPERVTPKLVEPERAEPPKLTEPSAEVSQPPSKSELRPGDKVRNSRTGVKGVVFQGRDGALAIERAGGGKQIHQLSEAWEPTLMQKKINERRAIQEVKGKSVPELKSGDAVTDGKVTGKVYKHGDQLRIKVTGTDGEISNVKLDKTWKKTTAAKKPKAEPVEAPTNTRKGERGAASVDVLSAGLAKPIVALHDAVDIEPTPSLKREGLSDAARRHASARISVPHVVDDYLAKVFPDQYRDPEAMAKTVDIINKDNILGGYYEFLDRAEQARDASDDAAADKWQERAENVGDIHDIDSLHAEVEAAKNDPVVSANIARWKEHVNPALDELYNKMKGVDPNTAREGRGAVFGARINLLTEAKAEEMRDFGVPDKPMPSPATANYRNPNVRRDQFDRAAKFTGKYSTDPQAVLANVLGPRLNETTKLDFYNAIIDKGIGQVVGRGENPPAEINGQKAVRLPVKMPETDAQGHTSIVEKNLYVQQNVAREVRDVLNTDMRLNPNRVSQWLTQIQLLQLADAVSHLKNIHTVIASAPATKSVMTDIARRFPGVGTLDSFVRIARVSNEIAKDSPAIRSEIADMAKQGLIRPHYPSTGVQKITRGQDMIHAVDTASRIVMNRFFTKLAKAGRVEDTAENRQSFVQQIGEYNDRLIGPLMRAAKQSGLSPFIVAGRTFNRVSKRLLTGNPGVQASSTAEAVKMRLGNLISGPVAVATIPAMINMLTTGMMGGRPGTPLGAIDLGKKEDDRGRHAVIDVAQILGYRRGLRATGLNALVEGLREGQSANEIVDHARQDVVSSAAHPWMGPALGFGYQTVTGSRLDLRGGPEPVEARNMSGVGNQTLENARVALKNQNPLLYSVGSFLYGTPEEKAEASYGTRILGAAIKSPASAVGVQNLSSPAMKLALEIRRAKGTYTTTPDQAKSRAKARELTDRANNGEDVDDEIQKAVDAGEISERQVANMNRNKNLSPLARVVKYMPLIPDAVRVYQRAGKRERQELDKVLAKKIQRKRGDLSENDQQTLRALGLMDSIDDPDTRGHVRHGTPHTTTTRSGSTPRGPQPHVP